LQAIPSAAQEETDMAENNVLIMLAVTAALAVSGAAAIAKDDIDNRGERGGAVTPCSLAGVNPVHHPEVFGNPAVAARDYGFIRSRDGSWRVQDNCQTRAQTQGLSESKKR
jgi:hypothetical protein